MTSKEFLTSWKKTVCSLICFFFVAVSFIATNSVLQAKGNENQEIEARVATLTAERNKLYQEKASLSSPQRVETIATETLGMIKATQEHIVYYEVSQKE